MNTITVRLKDPSACFFDQRNKIFISGKGAKTVPNTAKIAEGVRKGALIAVTAEEAKATAVESEAEKEAKRLAAEKLQAAEKEEKKSLLLAQLKADNVDLEKTDYEILKGWATTLEIEVSDKKKETFVAAIAEALK